MRRISDLTRDTRPQLVNLLIEASQDIAELDLHQENMDGDYIEIENSSFYYRVIYLFMQRAVLYYSETEINVWSKRELLDELVLPELVP